HGRASTNVHVIEALVRPSLAHIAYYSVTAVALLGLAALPLYLLGLFRLLPGRGERLTPWAQAALFPLVALAVFFGFLYDWQDKRFLYYLRPFSVAVAAEGISALRNFARGGKLRAAVAGLALGAVLFSNRIPYPAGTHSYVALTPSDFLDAAEGIGTAHVQSIPASGSWSLLTQDGFLSFARARGSCQMQAEATAIPSLRKFLDERLTRSEPVAWAGEGADSTSYWIETNRLAIALERAVVKPDSTRFILRRLHKPDPRALAAFGPFELFDLASFGRSSISLRRRGEHKDRRDREPLPRWHHRPLAV
ncbi:MAG: hypothetical protein ABI639_01810, partial [Thermoanaerobaculia bacterium]